MRGQYSESADREKRVWIVPCVWCTDVKGRFWFGLVVQTSMDLMQGGESTIRDLDTSVFHTSQPEMSNQLLNTEYGELSD